MQYKVREFREQKRMTQEELAERSGVSRGIIARLESGREFTTTTTTLVKIANALGKKTKDIFLD